MAYIGTGGYGSKGTSRRWSGVFSSSDVCGGVGGNPPAGRVGSIVMMMILESIFWIDDFPKN
jgi:hypothetical protein